MQAFIINILNNFGYLGISFLIFIENIFPPIPSETLLAFSGFATTLENSKLTIFLSVVFATIGSVLGAVALYYLGVLVNKDRVDIFLEKKWVKNLGFRKKEIDKTFIFFEKWRSVAVLFGRCVPIIRSLISIPAGMTRMNIWLYTLYTTIGSLIWNILIINAGAMLGKNWELVIKVLDHYKNIVLIILAVAIIYFGFNFFKKKKKLSN